MIYKGTCTAPIPLVTPPTIRTDSSGNGTRSTTLSVSHGAAIWSTAFSGGSVAIRVASGSAAYCAKLTYPLATRVQISRYGIDLPIVRQTGSYPYCNVAMYGSVLSQPGEAGPTFIYAHARTGMFLPLLTASQNNAAGMVGTTVRIWTSDSRLYAYRVSRVLRHQYTTPAYDARVETLWLQTSEGPHGAKNKLFIIGTPVSVELAASYADAHPQPHIVICP